MGGASPRHLSQSRRSREAWLARIKKQSSCHAAPSDDRVGVVHTSPSLPLPLVPSARRPKRACGQMDGKPPILAMVMVMVSSVVYAGALVNRCRYSRYIDARFPFCDTSPLRPPRPHASSRTHTPTGAKGRKGNKTHEKKTNFSRRLSTTQRLQSQPTDHCVYLEFLFCCLCSSAAPVRLVSTRALGAAAGFHRLLDARCAEALGLLEGSTSFSLWTTAPIDSDFPLEKRRDARRHPAAGWA